MKLKSILIIFILLLLLLPGSTFASSDLNLNTLDFNIILNSDGSMNVTEKWEIEIEDTNTLYKTFELTNETITDVKVTEIEDSGNRKEFTKSNEYAYHVTKDYYFGTINPDGDFEIAWGVSAKNETNTYEISYTVNNAVTTYNDCTELYWKFVGDAFEIPVDKLTGTISFEENIENQDIKMWAHGPLNGNIARQNNQIVFEVDYLEPNTFVEVRLAMPRALFKNNKNIVQYNQLQTILSQEQQWADEANRLRDEKIKEQEMEKIISTVFFIGVIVANIILSIVFIKKALKYYKILKENKKLEPTQKVDYFREIPDENSTPPQAAFLHDYSVFDNSDTLKSRIFSATILDLCLKKYISFELEDEKKNKQNIYIILNEKSDIAQLSADEKPVFELLLKVKEKSNTEKISMKDIEKYAEKNYSKFFKYLDETKSEAKNIQQEKGNYSKQVNKKGKDWYGKAIVYIITGVMAFSMFFLGIILLINAILCFKISNRMNGLTQKGIDEQELWKGLKKFMEDFSLLDKREVPELVLWEKYLVYATVFGIADKVLKQLKIVYPELLDANYLSNTSYMYLMYRNNNSFMFVNSLNKALNKAYDTGVSKRATAQGYSYGNYSSGGGGGGGFSGGGGGRRRRRPVVAEDNKLHINFCSRKQEKTRENKRKIKEKLDIFSSII